MPCATGYGGISARKREGDGVTPAGLFRVVGLLYRPDRIGRAALPDWARLIRPFDRWSDDPCDPHYNLYLPRATPGCSSERLSRPDPLYDLMMILDHNWPEAVPGRGSAIFLHVWRRPRAPTAGCVAFRRADLLWIAARFRHESRVVIQASAGSLRRGATRQTV
ncbi:MAG: L,D-transpeptidase family protein [Pseudomonadota bacterium]